VSIDRAISLIIDGGGKKEREGGAGEKENERSAVVYLNADCDLNGEQEGLERATEKRTQSGSLDPVVIKKISCVKGRTKIKGRNIVSVPVRVKGRERIVGKYVLFRIYASTSRRG